MAKKGSKSAVAASGDAERKDDDRVLYWLNEIDAAKKREKDFRKDGERINEIYDGRKSESTPFNILFSNTETLQSALYSRIPRPVVQRRFKDDDPLGKAASDAAQRMGEFLLDTNIEGYESFDDAMRAGVLAALVPGRGVTSVKYDFEEGQLAPAQEPASEDGTGDEPPPEPTPYKKSELVCTDSREWNRFYHGYARKWSRVPWIAYEEHIDKGEATRLFGAKVANEITYTVDEDTDEEKNKTDKDDRDKGERKTALIYKVWDKRGGRKVRFVSPHHKHGFLKEMDDPLGLTGFFDCPRPLAFVSKVNDLLPVALYVLYENQHAELNRIQVRINRMVNACKARGVYDSSLGTVLEKIMEEADNALVPTDDGVLGEKTLSDSIWFMPLAEIIATLERLYQARESCKTVIFEIVGIADIMRGASKASETLGAQEIKNQWGTLRIKPKQSEVQRYARDLIRMMIEVAASKFSVETWAKMTGLKYSTEEQRQQAQMLLQAAQAQMPPPVPGQPPQPPPPAVMQAQAVLQAPQWEAVLKLLQDDLTRSFRIDIETNSTLEPEAAEDQKAIAELLNMLGQFLNGVGGLVEKGVLPFQVAQSMMLAISRRYRFGNEIEDQIKAMKPPPPQDDGAAQQAQQQVADAQAAAQKSEQGKMQSDMKLAAAQEQIKLLQKTIELNDRERDLDMREQLFKIEKQAATESLAMRDKAGNESLQNKEKVNQIREQHANKEQAHAERAKKQNEGTTKELVSASAEVKQLKEIVVQALDGNQKQMQELVRSLVAVMSAPRKRTLERGPDGRATGMREELEAPQAIN